MEIDIWKGKAKTEAKKNVHALEYPLCSGYLLSGLGGLPPRFNKIMRFLCPPHLKSDKYGSARMEWGGGVLPMHAPGP